MKICEGLGQGTFRLDLGWAGGLSTLCHGFQPPSPEDRHFIFQFCLWLRGVPALPPTCAFSPPLPGDQQWVGVGRKSIWGPPSDSIFRAPRQEDSGGEEGRHLEQSPGSAPGTAHGGPFGLSLWGPLFFPLFGLCLPLSYLGNLLWGRFQLISAEPREHSLQPGRLVLGTSLEAGWGLGKAWSVRGKPGSGGEDVEKERG